MSSAPTIPTTLNYVTLDVFTSTPFAGNPLAIVQVPRGVSLTQVQKQIIAREFNYSETVFLHEHGHTHLDDEDPSWTMDIFTTTDELPFAGHPTIGTACYAMSAFGAVRGKLNLKAGLVNVSYDLGTRRARAAIPQNVHIHNATVAAEQLLAMQPSLDVRRDLTASGFLDLPRSPVVSIVPGMTFVLVQLPSLHSLATIGVSSGDVQVTLDPAWSPSFVSIYFYVLQPEAADGTHNIRTRMMANGFEDPATGSAASALAAFLALKRHRGGDRLRFLITQGVEMGRQSEIGIDVDTCPDGTIQQITLAGTAIKVMNGRIYLK
ncbi:uncharacterized protein V1513DRAFT_45265 [Lipomyces chichibuensis]|uniref:uncharacterized protein n=1 Tax=Lipomyces chichibuensis TaxID=1546026 RepID=UPI003344125E